MEGPPRGALPKCLLGRKDLELTAAMVDAYNVWINGFAICCSAFRQLSLVNFLFLIYFANCCEIVEEQNANCRVACLHYFTFEVPY